MRCWIAPRDIIPGDEWGAAIIKGLKSCRLMVLIFSRHANASAQVRREVERAISRGMTVIPVRAEDVVPVGAMEFALGNTHWLDAFTPPVEQKLELLARTVVTFLDAPGIGDDPVSAANPRDGNRASPRRTATSEETGATARLTPIVPPRPVALPRVSIAKRRQVLIAVIVTILGLGAAGGIRLLVLASFTRKPTVAAVQRALQLHFKGTIGLPPEALPNSTLGEKRLIQAVFLSMPDAGGDLSLLSEALRKLNDRNFFQSEGFLDVHVESVLLQLAMIRDVRLEWLTNAETELAKMPSGAVDLPSFCQIDPSISPKPSVHLTRAGASDEIEQLRRASLNP